MNDERTESAATQPVALKPAPAENVSFRDLLEQVSEGSEEAAWDLVENYGVTILRAVRRALDSRMRQRFDSTDFVQLVWASFFKARGRLDRFSTPAELAAFLVKMARNKVGMEARGCLVRPGAPYAARCRWIGLISPGEVLHGPCRVPPGKRISTSASAGGDAAGKPSVNTGFSSSEATRQPTPLP